MVRLDPTAPAGDHVLAQVDEDGTDYRFPVATADAPALRNLRAEVRCNYYLVRANALEDNVNLYRVVDGRRRQIKGWSGRVASGMWHALAIEARGHRLQVIWEGKPIIDATDDTFSGPGKVGVWTKADSVTFFDALSVTELP